MYNFLRWFVCRRALKAQAGSFGEEGFKYAGMSAEQLLLVNEFAQNLRYGNMDIPLSEKSYELMKMNNELKEEIKVRAPF
jgi:hypothetical protein